MPMCGKEKEQGAVEVEVMVMLPVAILSVAMLLYLSLFLFQRANLQACLETGPLKEKQGQIQKQKNT